VLVYAGQNGWAFFDYHLAMFGPQEVPLGPFRLQMALPPFGCDPGAYTVRIQGAVVAILRGGGCSFGIKVRVLVCLGIQVPLLVFPMSNPARPVPLSLGFPAQVINAQKLGAKAVIIVNTDDMKTMRLMALPDEVPLITIPCIMVSRPTGVFGEYEKRNELALPERLKIH
jgi:hypothetical protein